MSDIAPAKVSTPPATSDDWKRRYDALLERYEAQNDALQKAQNSLCSFMEALENRAVARANRYYSPMGSRIWEHVVAHFLARMILDHTRTPMGRLGHHQPRALRYPRLSWRSHKNWPTISITTPSFNQGRYLEQTLRSVLEQNYPALQYTLQDSCSTDNTPDVLERYAAKLDCRVEKDKGQSDAINLGLRNTTGEIMAWLNSDDMLCPGALFVVADYFLRHPEVDAVYGHRILIDENSDEIGRWYLPQYDRDEIRYVDFIPQETLFWRRSIWERAGGKIDETISFSMDWDFILRMKRAGAKFVRIPAFLGCFRVHNQQKTLTIQEVNRRDDYRLRMREFGGVHPAQVRIDYFSHLAIIRSFLCKHFGPFF